MTQPTLTYAYEMTFNLLVEWQAHGLSNSGAQQSNRTLPRQQLLADGTEVDAISGNLEKQRHASILAEYLAGYGDYFCSACLVGDSRRAAAAKELGPNLPMEAILACGLCDTHGFLRLGKKETASTPGRMRKSKDTVIDYSFALALPGHHHVSYQTFTRKGISNEGEDEEGQMIFRTPSRSGRYALIVRYTCASIGRDSQSRQLVISDEGLRKMRHRAILLALRDQMLSPSGANTARMLPHTTALSGAVVIRTQPGRAPVYSPLMPNFTQTLGHLCEHQRTSCSMHVFDTIVEFSEILGRLADTIVPYSHENTR